MNAIGELDLELLEDYLDDALSPAQVQHVANRLVTEPELALAMHELRAGRVLRAAAVRSMEPSEAAASAIADRVCNAIRAQERRRKLRRLARIGSGLAAGICLAVAGWCIRGPASPVVFGPGQPARLGSRSTNTVAIVEPAESFHVELIGTNGKVVPVQKFSRLEEAREFAHDLMLYESRRQEAAQGSAILVSDHF